MVREAASGALPLGGLARVELVTIRGKVDSRVRRWRVGATRDGRGSCHLPHRRSSPANAGRAKSATPQPRGATRPRPAARATTTRPRPQAIASTHQRRVQRRAREVREHHRPTGPHGASESSSSQPGKPTAAIEHEQPRARAQRDQRQRRGEQPRDVAQPPRRQRGRSPAAPPPAARPGTSLRAGRRRRASPTTTTCAPTTPSSSAGARLGLAPRRRDARELVAARAVEQPAGEEHEREQRRPAQQADLAVQPQPREPRHPLDVAEQRRAAPRCPPSAA